MTALTSPGRPRDLSMRLPLHFILMTATAEAELDFLSRATGAYHGNRARAVRHDKPAAVAGG